ncbi:hypothetical protein BJ684DRAFT_21346 [Piptocephalis cylindrospora]|uniref:Uncharacterized protein n=1 Tax=Piptocephalis cylindrospora TaxID=1907219 RepID=A0A4P9Y219_9FUNG|nr:hypothetical protein BJ684DRAFT_21346 [Piptocephalis cylindrospora]|eukprot:RKP12091.1 hypothetical protein BJ684DRAFT_21346 [Piptocephalis cylindrospora]
MSEPTPTIAMSVLVADNANGTQSSSPPPMAAIIAAACGAAVVVAVLAVSLLIYRHRKRQASTNKEAQEMGLVFDLDASFPPSPERLTPFPPVPVVARNPIASVSKGSTLNEADTGSWKSADPQGRV